MGPIQGDLYPPPRGAGELIGQFRDATGRIISEADALAGGIAAARSSGAGLGGSSQAIAGQVSAIASGVGDSYPGHEVNEAGLAGQNSPGVSGAIGNAEASSGDPRVNVPGVDTGGGTGWIGGNAGDIRGRGGTVANSAGEADHFEREALERQI
jgi:hypothetical protein